MTTSRVPGRFANAVTLIAVSVALGACAASEEPQAANQTAGSGQMPETFEEFDPDNALDAIISPDSLRGVDAQLRIIDADVLADSLEAAGLDQAQVEMVRSGDISLEGYLALSRLEVQCVRAQGIETEAPTVVEFEYGLSSPTYSYAAVAPGLTEDEIAYRQITCQNAFTGAYQYLYEAKFLPSAEERQRLDIEAANSFIACAIEKGLTPPIEQVQSADDLDIFYTWFSTPETDINCVFKP